MKFYFETNKIMWGKHERQNNFLIFIFAAEEALKLVLW